MDSSFIVRPPARSTAQSASARGARPPGFTTAEPVTPVAKSVEARVDDSAHVRSVVLDAQSREVIYREIEARSRGAARRVPEAAVQRLKAYARAAGESAKQRGTNTDTEL